MNINQTTQKTLLIGLMSFLFPALLFSQAENAKNYIEGTFTIVEEDGEFIYKLSELNSQGISFENKGTLFGTETSEGFQQFVFNNAKIPCNEFLELYKWDKEMGQWQIDSEIKSGTAQFSTTKTMVVMLVLDCSNSLGGGDFMEIQESANEFITTLGRGSNYAGNIHVGIIGFNSMKNTDRMIFDILPLDSENDEQRLISFISNLETGPNTAMYYAMKKGSEMLDRYVSDNANSENFNFEKALIVSFTDGCDNQSIDAKIGKPADGLENPYFKYVQNLISSKRIQGRKIDSYVIGVKGEDVGNNAQFTTILENLASSESNFYNADNIEQVKMNFNLIAKDLIAQWQDDLICFVPPSFEGKVRWVLKCNEPESQYTLADTTKVSQKKNGIGIITGGNVYGVLYKRLSGNFAFQGDFFLCKLSLIDLSMEANMNLMYQNLIKKRESGLMVKNEDKIR